MEKTQLNDLLWNAAQRFGTERTSAGSEPAAWRAAFAAAGDLAGPPELTEEERRALREAGAEPDAWSAADLLRAALLVSASQSVGGMPLAQLAEDAYRGGDAASKASVLRALGLLPEPAFFLPFALDA